MMVSTSRLVTTALVVSMLLIQASSSLMEWGDPRRPIADDASRRRKYISAHAASYISTLDDSDEDKEIESPSQFPGSSRRLDFGSNLLNCHAANYALRLLDGQEYAAAQSSKDKLVVLINRVKMWPPWPLTLLGRKKEDDELDGAVTAKNTYSSAGALFWAYFKQRTRIGVRQIQEVGSQLWFHLPPAAPPLFLLASLPRKILVEDKETGVAVARTVVPILANPFARKLALCGLGFAVMSWAHMEVHRKRKLAPLPLKLPYQSVSRVFLPPVLPELVPEPEIEALQSAEESVEEESKTLDDADNQKVMSLMRPKLRKHLNDLYENAPRPKMFQIFLEEWKRSRDARRRESAKIRRLRIFDELVALQAIKRKSARKYKYESTGNGEDRPGYALVTGASQGIGRAIAVELARWEIPLVLVARDIDRLISLAYDLEACYGVKVCVLKADLAQIDSAERLHEATQKAGITVDILVNNAGIAYEGLSVDIETDDVERMVMINAMAYAKLSKLYGQDMRARGRGRILMVSSMAGLTSSSPNTALYGATKAFSKSLALSMAKELEPYGVGITCLMPGPVVNTQFRERSRTGRALCWYIPFYARPASTVAHLGVMSLLDGDTQVIPGWQNRVFVRLLIPILPQRVETMCVQAAWTPLRLPHLSLFRRRQDERTEETRKPEKSALIDTTPSPAIHLDLKPRYNMQQAPRLLILPEKELAKAEPVEPETVEPEPVEPEPEPLPEPSVATSEPTEKAKGVEEQKETDEAPPPLQDVTTLPHSSVEKEESGAMKVEANNTKERLQEGTPSAPGIEKEEGALENENQNQDAEESDDATCVDTNRRSEEEPMSRWFKDGDADLSPRLGAVDLMEHPHFALLQKLQVVERPNYWTIQT